jgi:chromate transporter
MVKTLIDLFMAFFRASILSYGGGPAAIPLMQNEVVNKYKWFSKNEFADALAIGNTLPGPIAPKMAAYVGYNVSGTWGAVISVIASVVPTALAMVILAGILLKFKDSARLKGMLRVAKPIVVILLLQSSVDLMTRGNYYSYIPFIISIIAAALVFLLKVNPAYIIAGGLFIGFTLHKFI